MATVAPFVLTAAGNVFSNSFLPDSHPRDDGRTDIVAEAGLGNVDWLLPAGRSPPARGEMRHVSVFISHIAVNLNCDEASVAVNCNAVTSPLHGPVSTLEEVTAHG